MGKVKDRQLVSILHYAKHHNFGRRNVYRWIEKGWLTRYRDPEGKPLLELNQKPLPTPEADSAH